MKPVEIKNFVKRINVKGLNFDEQILEIGKQLEPNFQINDDNFDCFNQLKLYFTNDRRFNGDLRKSIMVSGGFGSGKTLALQIFQIASLLNGSNLFMMYDTDEIVEAFIKNGRLSIENFNNLGDIAIDELGQDSGRYNYFGSEEDPRELLLSRRYNAFKSNGFRTHCITNLNSESLEKRFSGKIYDRICEMYNLIPLTCSSWRRK